MIDRKKLASLPPNERIEKLRLIEEARKKEHEEIETLIEESMSELNKNKIAKDIAPDTKAIDISNLFTKQGGKLERTIQSEQKPKGLFLKGNQNYQLFSQAYEDYQSLKMIIGYSTRGALSQDQLSEIDAIGERLDKTRYENTSTELANMVIASRTVLNKIRNYLSR